MGDYTIAGGYSAPGDADGVSHAYLVDYHAVTGAFTHWTTFDYPNGPAGKTFVTHFEGISSPSKGMYTLAADAVEVGKTSEGQGALMAVRRNPDGSFGPTYWVDLNYPGAPGLTSANSVAGGQVVGIQLSPDGNFSYQASVNLGFQLSNVISGNRGNGIGLYGASDNRIAMNNIGTDATGFRALGNGRNGVLLTQGASRNYLGGQTVNGNDPTAGQFSRPPQGNLISGNRQNGVRIEQGSNANLLSGNFIGTRADGNGPLGNRGDGISIDRSNGNQLIGCTFQQDPFVFYNVVSGNGGNGLTVHSANNTVVQANFFGAGANNASVVANHGDGILVSGTSQNTQIGGVIPLGNVISGNGRNGTEIRDQAAGTVNFNTFAGVFAFSGAAPNRRDGFLVTSTGGNNQIRTCIVAGNLGNGIEISGNASGVQVEQTASGTNTAVQYAIPNGGSGLVISGRAHDNTIGGFQPSVETADNFSGNSRYGVEITGSANHNVVFNSLIGVSDGTGMAIPNAMGGVYLGPQTSYTTAGWRGHGSEPDREQCRAGGGDSGCSEERASGERHLVECSWRDPNGLGAGESDRDLDGREYDLSERGQRSGRFGERQRQPGSVQ